MRETKATERLGGLMNSTCLSVSVNKHCVYIPRLYTDNLVRIYIGLQRHWHGLRLATVICLFLSFLYAIVYIRLVVQTA